MTSDLQHKSVQLHFLTSFYDFTASPTNPIKTKQDHQTSITNYGLNTKWYQNVKENIVTFVNGTSQTFFTLSSKESFNVEVNTPVAFEIIFQIDSEYDVYEQYQLTQVRDPTTRRLDVETIEDKQRTGCKAKTERKKSTLFKVLELVGQVGGLFTLAVILMS